MNGEWYYSHDGERHGPVSADQIRALAADGRLRADDLVWQAGMEAWTQLGHVPGLLPPAAAPPPLPVRDAAPPPVSPAEHLGPDLADVQGKKLVAGLCAILVGAFGIHKFVLGMNTPGIIMLAVTLVSMVGGGFCCFPVAGSLVMWVIGLVEGILYLTRSDEEFYQTYMVRQKEWF
ncbi:MAG TPA: GYF domain-containing protein [Gemmataceae bacterium]|jgi:TM2 domain-containing membrane protein YozV